MGRSWLRVAALWLAGGAVIVLALAGWATFQYGSPRAAVALLRGDELLVTPRVSSLGHGRLGEQRTVEVRLTNLRGRPVKIIGARSSCTCAVVDEALPVAVESGESLKLKIMVAYVGSPGPFERSVELYTDAGGASVTALVRGWLDG